MITKYLPAGLAIFLSLFIVACGSAHQAVVETVIEEADEEPQSAVVETVVVEEQIGSDENIIAENWIETEIEMEILVETNSSDAQSSIYLKDEQGNLIESVSGDTAFGTVWSLAPGDRVVLDCSTGVRCTHEIIPVSKNETFIERTNLDCNNNTIIYEHDLDMNLDLLVIVEDQCEGEGMEKQSSLSIYWYDENGKHREKQRNILDHSKLVYGRTVTKKQNDIFVLECCGKDSGECFYEVKQIVKE